MVFCIGESSFERLLVKSQETARHEPLDGGITVAKKKAVKKAAPKKAAPKKKVAKKAKKK